MVTKPYFGYVWPHAVQPGETWASIADRYNVTVEDLEHLNPALASRELTPGLVVYVPLGSEPQMPAEAPELSPGAWMPAPGVGAAPSQGALTEGSPDVFLGGQGHQGHLQQPPEVMPDEGVEPWNAPDAEASAYENGGPVGEIAEQTLPGPEGDGGPHMHQLYRWAESMLPETDEEGWSKPFVVRVGNDA
ncbi:LysM peptidoglycan-binding domain-containing protein [Alicyclobacillus acidocaldarius]|uniref:Peptidoglycan-binding LysM n=1 Tax=Alicyclobacillus acidocaldarius (strain Tc-4-1) TaxID=1048834 RepID=F8IFR2_ALIAT|nr:LysM domain-containing protein [Alicyclobacillus acidocaldarius]AEJ44146.1 Peptidoglycan-binding LysM [Alicyclobacillus acidocaldarius subsp. acidocaldarius Tc-4-1]